jgi:hypothetical protein
MKNNLILIIIIIFVYWCAMIIGIILLTPITSYLSKLKTYIIVLLMIIVTIGVVPLIISILHHT